MKNAQFFLLAISASALSDGTQARDGFIVNGTSATRLSGADDPFPVPGPAPDNVQGQFFVSCYADNCIDGAGAFGSCPGWQTANEVICFGGASDYSFWGQQFCLKQELFKGRQNYANAETYSTDKLPWYSIGGGPNSPSTWWQVQTLTALNSHIGGDGDITTATHYGIVYDIEILYYNPTDPPKVDDLVAAFTESFQLAQAAGLKVMVTTSGNAPYPYNPIKDKDGTVLSEFNEVFSSTVFKRLLALNTVDIWAPQFYGQVADGKLGTNSGNSIGPGGVPQETYGGGVEFSDWNVVSGKIYPVIAVYNGGNGFITNFNDQVGQYNDWCTKNTSLQNTPWCQADQKFYIWTNN